MLPALRSRFDRIERQRAALLAPLRPVGDTTLRFQPPTGGWSVLQVVEHLVLAEELTVEQMARITPRPVPLRKRVRTGVMIGVIRTAFLVRARIKAPSSALEPPVTDVTLDQLMQRWAEARCRMAERLDAVTMAQLPDRVMRHPYAGWFTHAQMLDFFHYHTVHHQRQMGRIQRARRLAAAH